MQSCIQTFQPLPIDTSDLNIVRQCKFNAVRTNIISINYCCIHGADMTLNFLFIYSKVYLGNLKEAEI